MEKLPLLRLRLPPPPPSPPVDCSSKHLRKNIFPTFFFFHLLCLSFPICVRSMFFFCPSVCGNQEIENE